MYTVIDIETTGGNQKQGKITEIAAFAHDGSKCTGKFSTLINPRKAIPPFITKLTGISNEMVADAPTFEEIADELEAFTANTIFVAHNVHFDYGFIKEEYRKLGRNFQRKTLCTVQLSRQSFPGLKSYSLSEITRQFDIELNGHHRAEVDAKATVALFEKLLEANQHVGIFERHFGLEELAGITSPLIDMELLQSIPDECGIYKLFDAADALIYVKRSSQILTALCQKLLGNQTKDSAELRNKTHRLDWQITGGSLAAQLLEWQAVLLEDPPYNYGKGSAKVQCGLIHKRVEEGHMLLLQRVKKKDPYLRCYSSFHEGMEDLKALADRVGGKLVLNSSAKRVTPSLTVSDEAYARALARSPQLIIDDGRTAQSVQVIYCEGMMPLAMGETDSQIANYDDLAYALSHTFKPAPELEMIVRQQLNKSSHLRIIKLTGPLQLA